MIQATYTNIDILGLQKEYPRRSEFRNYPPCQREKVWTLGMKQRLIDSILRGLYVPAIVFIQRSTVFGVVKEILDGQQRFESIIEYLDDGYPTASPGKSDEPGTSPIEPGRRFSQLSEDARRRFSNYQLQAFVLPDTAEVGASVGMMFRRLQSQSKLTGAEILYSYSSATRDAAVSIAIHPLWESLYQGKRNRKQPFMMGVYILGLELQGGFANLTTPRVKDIASGMKDGVLNPELSAVIRRRLDAALKLFDSSVITGMTDIIPIYQAASLLDEAGAHFAQCTSGALTSWYMAYKEQAIKAQRTHGFQGGVFTSLTKAGQQRKFWADQLPVILATDGIVVRDTRRSFNMADRFSAWNTQGGKCAVCHRPVRIQDVGHHLVLHSVGGATDAANCQLVHKDCHEQLHHA